MSEVLFIAGTEIPVDEFGRVSLNALHHASGTSASKAPSQWLANKATQELIDELNSQSGNYHSGDMRVISVKNGGNKSGTYAHELLAVSYAGWISPRFQLQVNQVFIDYKTGKIKPIQVQPSINSDKEGELAASAMLAKLANLSVSSSNEMLRVTANRIGMHEEAKLIPFYSVEGIERAGDSGEQSTRAFEALTDLLAKYPFNNPKNGQPLTAVSANKLMAEVGITEKRLRRSSAGKMKHEGYFLTEDYRRYGVSHQTKYSTKKQQHYFEDTFVELMATFFDAFKSKAA